MGQHRRRLLMTRQARPLPVLSDARPAQHGPGTGPARSAAPERRGSADRGSTVVSTPGVLARVRLGGQVPAPAPPPPPQPPHSLVPRHAHPLFLFLFSPP